MKKGIMEEITVNGLDIYKVRKDLIRFIKSNNKDEITYEDFLIFNGQEDPPDKNQLKKILFKYLTAICKFEASRKRPLLSIVVVANSSMIPGKGFFKIMAKIRKENYDEIRSDLTLYVKEKKKCLKYWRKDRNYKKYNDDDEQLEETLKNA